VKLPSLIAEANVLYIQIDIFGSSRKEKKTRAKKKQVRFQSKCHHIMNFSAIINTHMFQTSIYVFTFLIENQTSFPPSLPRELITYILSF